MAVLMDVIKLQVLMTYIYGRIETIAQPTCHKAGWDALAGFVPDQLAPVTMRRMSARSAFSVKG
jgi:hypothetical protein